MTTKEEALAIRKALRSRGFTGRVTMARGTAYGYIDIEGSGEFGEFTYTERNLLKSLGFNPGGNCCTVSPDETRYWTLKLTDPTNPLIIIERDRANRAFQRLLEN